MTRADSLISEFAARHGSSDASFLTAVRPMVERLLGDGTPEISRDQLLELLAETFEHEARLRRDLDAAREHQSDYLQRLRRQFTR